MTKRRQKPNLADVRSQPKRGPGAPKLLEDAVYVRSAMPAALVARVDAWAREQEVGRSEALRRLVQLGLIGSDSK